MVKMNNPKGNDIEPVKYPPIKCPICGRTTEVERIIDLKIDSRSIELHGDVGYITQCVKCFEYLEKIDGEFKLITKTEIIDRQTKITDLFIAEDRIARARIFPTVAAAEIAKAEAGRLLSFTLYTLTAENIYHRAYSVEEILEACSAMGFNPSAVDNATIPHVVAWLSEHKGT